MTTDLADGFMAGNAICSDYSELAVTIEPRRMRRAGNLAPWQCGRLKRYIDEHLAHPITNADLARVVGLSESHFCHAFRVSFGQSPHRYVVERRIREAKTLMLRSSESLSSIAAVCGFTDQAHMTRWFGYVLGQPPGCWRRERRRPKLSEVSG